MIRRNFLRSLSELYRDLKDNLKTIYQNSNFYEKKISKVDNITLEYKPSPHLLSSIIKYQKKKYKIEDFALESIWLNNINSEDFKKLNNFFWFFSLDLKSSKKKAQSVIKNWIKNNVKYDSRSWEFNITSKRIISWLSNHQLTYEDSNQEYKFSFDYIIKKQANHLIYEVKTSKEVDDKIVGCAAIILTGLTYQNHKKYISFGLSLLKEIIKISIDNQGFPKSRNIKQLCFYLKYFILIREWFKESQNVVPEYIDETIYYLGSNYAFVWQNINHDILFNGNYISNNIEFDHYLKRLGYKFTNKNKEVGGYAILKNKKIILIMDIGPSPNKNFSKNYQSGALSFEVISSGKKLISNSGYFADKNSKLNKFSKSTALHNTLIIEDNSSCKFKKIKKVDYIIDNDLNITKKNIVCEDNYWKITAAHDGYYNKFKTIHEREIEFYPEQTKFIGFDRLVRKDPINSIKFDIRFHLNPNSKVMKTQDNKSIFIELEDEGWKFNCENYDINIDNGLYFDNKNSFKDNQNIFISGMTNASNEIVKWEITKL
tara:strand:+ start:1149 stop:2777 length:1629 start_codon:yes stop_codon:yes gene_type:complete